MRGRKHSIGGSVLAAMAVLGAGVAIAGEASFQAPIPIDTEQRPVDIAIGKLGTGPTKDIVVANRDGRSLAIIQNEGGGEFSDADLIEQEGQPQGVTIADVDEDGVRDIVASSDDDVDRVLLYRGKRSGGFRDPEGERVDGAVELAHVAVADLDRDGYPDVVAAEGEDQKNSVWVLYGTAGGLGEPKRFRLKAGEDEGTYFQAIAVADFDEDGIRDIAVTAFRGGEWVLWGKGSAANPDRDFKAKNYEAPGGAAGLDVGDIDNDGRLDLVIVANDELLTLLGRSTRGFQAPIARDANGSASVSLGEFDDDEWTDAAVATFDANQVQIFYGGPGGFSDPQNLPIQPDAIDVEVAQLDEAADDDVVSALFNNSRINVLLTTEP